MCVYKRLDKLPLTEEMLAKQTYKDFDFHIWNNAGEENVGGLGRFILASQLVNKYDYVIFIDDDQIFEDTFIEQMVKQAKPKTIAGWYAWENHGKYWDRTPATDKATYVGTGGMICDINDIWLSMCNRRRTEDVLQWKIHNLHWFYSKVVPNLSDDIKIIEFSKMTTDKQYLENTLLYFGINDVDMESIDLSVKVNTTKNKLYPTFDDLTPFLKQLWNELDWQ